MTTANAAAIAPDTDNIASLIGAWKLMVGRLPESTITQESGVAAMIGHVPLPFFNFMVLDRSFETIAQLETALARAREHDATCAHHTMLAACTNWLPAGWEAAFAAANIVPSMNMTGMAADTLAPPRRPLPRIEYRTIDTVAAATDAAHINARAYGLGTEAFDCICNLHLWQENSFGIVGHVDGRAVATTATFLVGDELYVAMVATEPDLHGRGYADAVMRHSIAMAQAAVGPRRIWLHATDMGRPVYAAMGFATGTATPVHEFA